MRADEERRTARTEAGQDAKEEGHHAGWKLHFLVGAVLVLSVGLVFAAVWPGERSLTLFTLMDDIPIYFHVDALGRLFAVITSVIWLITGIYAFLYMKHEGEEKRFFGFYLLAYGVLISLDFAGNLITLYFFYELMTLTSMPFVLHSGSKEAIMAALKYLFYSMCGAYCALFGIYVLYQYCDTLTFTAGGTLNPALAAGNGGILLIAVSLMLLGFGAKAGMFPLHAWLTAAHPAAPAPASAALSAIIVKSGVLAVIRGVYYIIGPDFIRGTWVQTAWMSLSLLTVFMGSMLAYREKVFKKRLAYSTVSQVSYILFGLSLLTPTGMTGALLHVVFHAGVKCALFLTAGIFIFRTGKTRVDEYAGIGKRMKVTLWCYTFASLALIGIPPFSGFTSKWYLAQGALQSETGIFRILGPVILLVSALLTAGYLLPITMKGFLPGVEGGNAENQAEETGTLPSAGRIPGEADSGSSAEKMDKMSAALLVLTVLTVFLGIWPNPLIQYAAEIAAAVM
ncbi:MAG: proton-conducting membrane transporter [Lachnospiraceae bacterium]|nr:proton-conducting membrane transporter [Lachnospiraceae bacterium]